ncbi:hypothetical protein NBEOAGPD_5124 [Methylobacterium gregans]|uniref:Uncharacterized protein n=1 Tax=Methylobacterium gregans TaxID=374424 RepID=A0AA37HX56_9HYPH|nr:hypothetical protein NBEOAGPD_5124 [Methylobacterium gregans]
MPETGHRTLTARFPGSEAQAFPRRPRPASCIRAAIQSGPVSPARASANASAFVEPRRS